MYDPYHRTFTDSRLAELASYLLTAIHQGPTKGVQKLKPSASKEPQTVQTWVRCVFCVAQNQSNSNCFPLMASLGCAFFQSFTIGYINPRHLGLFFKIARLNCGGGYLQSCSSLGELTIHQDLAGIKVVSILTRE